MYHLTLSADRKWGVAFCVGGVVALFRLGLLSRCKLIQGVGLGNHVLATLIKVLQDAENQLRATGSVKSVDIASRRKVLQVKAWTSLQEQHLVELYRQLFDLFCNKNHELEFATAVVRHPLTPWRTLWNAMLANSHQLPQGRNALALDGIQVSSMDTEDPSPVMAFIGYDSKAKQLVAFTNDEKAPNHLPEEHTVRCYRPQSSLSVSVLATSAGLPLSIQKQYYDTQLKVDDGKNFSVENATKVDRYGLALSQLYWLRTRPQAVIVIDGCHDPKDWNHRHIDALLCGPRLHGESVRLLSDRVISPFEYPRAVSATADSVEFGSKPEALLHRFASSDTRMDAEDVDLLVHAANWGYALTVFYHGDADQRDELGQSLLDTALPDVYDILPTLFKRSHSSIHIEDTVEDEYQERQLDIDEEKDHLL